MHFTHTLPALLFALGGFAVPLFDSAAVVPRQSFISGTCTVANNQCTVEFAPGSPYNFTCGLIIIIAGPTYIAEDMKCRQDGDVSLFFLASLLAVQSYPVSRDFGRGLREHMANTMDPGNTAVPILWRLPRQDGLRMPG